MLPKLTEEMRSALSSTDAGSIEVLDESTQKIYLLVENPQDAFEEWLRRELRSSFEQADRRDVVEWNPERIKQLGRERLASRTGNGGPA